MRRMLLAMAAVALWAAGAAAAEPSGTVRVSQVQVAFFVSGNVGGGTLTFNGRNHDFSIGGLGYGGFGASKVEATGAVHNLKRLEDFEGAYVVGRVGAVAGDRQVRGGMWLHNANGVEMNLSSTREGYALSLGGDAVYITFD